MPPWRMRLHRCVLTPAPSALQGALSKHNKAREPLWMSMISAQMHFAFVARENRYTLFQIML
jgi:hypothetical protein